MIYLFELYRRDRRRASVSLIKSIREECHPDTIERRAKALLWTMALPEVQDLVIVRDASDGREIYRKTIGTTYQAHLKAT